MNDPSPLIFDLTADDPLQYRNLAESDWETLRGKHNRIAIGTPLCAREAAVKKGGLLTADELRAYPTDKHDFYRLSLSLTLLPDVQCRFRSVDFLMDLESVETDSKIPLFARLEPREEVSKKAIKLSSSDSAKLAVKDTVFEVVSAELGGSGGTETQFERLEVQLASFGVNTRSAGWRFKFTDSREIPLSYTQLKALAVLPRGQKGKIKFRVTAQIEVQAALDRLLTKLFLRNSPPNTSADYEFP